MEHIRKLIEEVLEKGYVMSLGTLDDGGVWVADVSYVHDADFNIYWKSEVSVRHSKAILNEPNVASTITVSGAEDLSHGIQISGIAEKIKGGNIDIQRKFAKKKNEVLPIDQDSMTGTKSWYVLRPKKIELIHRKLFGFEKQNLDLAKTRD